MSATLILSVFSIVSVSAVSGTTYYLFGYINGANYACEEDNRNMGEYKFENGMLTVKFDMVSYVAVKEENNTNWYMTNGWVGEVSSAELYNTSITGENSNKLKVPAGVDVTFTLVENNDGSLTLSYQVAEQFEGQYRNELWDEVYIMSSDLYPENYTEDSYKEFKKALEEAETVLENLNSTDEELIKAKNNLISAKNNLVTAEFKPTESVTTESTQPTTSAADTTQATNNNAEFEPGAVIVSLKYDSPSVTSLLKGFEIEESRLITPGSDTQNVYLVRFKEKTKEIVWRAIDVLKKSPYVITAEPDYYQYIDDEIEETTSDNNSTEPTEPSTDKPTELATTESTEPITDKPTEPVTTEPTESSSETLPKPSDPVPTETEPNPTEPSETATELISVDPMPPFEAVGKVGEYIFGYYDAECYELNQTCEIGAYTFFVDGSFYQYCGITDGKKFTPLVIAYEKGLINDEQLDKTVELMNLRIKEKGYFNTAGWTVMPTEPVTTEPTETITDKPTEPVTTEPIVINPQPTENKPTTPAVVKPTVKKKANPVKVTVKTRTVKLKKLKKKAQKVKSITVKKAQGKVSYKLIKSGVSKKIRKLVSINKKGAITIKKWKKAKKGNYKIKLKITAKGNSKYYSKTLNKTVKIEIK